MTLARRIATDAAYSAGADLGSKLATVALFVVLARKVGDAHFGVFTFALSLVALLTVLADFGQTAVLTREVARRPAVLDHYFANTIVLQIVLAAPAVAIAAVAVGGAGRETRVVVLLLGCAVVAEQVRATCFGVFAAFQRFVFMPVALIGQRVLTTLGCVVALVLGRGVEAVAALYLAGALFAVCLSLFLLVRHIARPRIRVTPRAWKGIAVAAFPVGLAGVLGTVLFRADTSMLAAFAPSDVVGHYGAAYRLFEATLFIGWSIGAAAYPVYVRLGRHASPSAGEVFERSVTLSAALAFPAAVTAAVLARPLIDLLYGAQYSAAVDALRWLAPAIALYAPTYLATLFLIARDRQRVVTIVMGVVAAENVAANLILIPRLSLDGAAAGTSLSQTLACALLVGAAAREAGDVAWTRMLAGPVLASAAMALAMLALHGSPAAAFSVGAAVYATALGCFERVTYPAEARAIVAIFRPRGTAVPPPAFDAGARGG